MAFPHSNDKAQNPALCQFCEESNIKWKCINCDLFLCQLCNSRIHNKSKASKDHTIINLKDCGTEETKSTILKVDLQNMPYELKRRIDHDIQWYGNEKVNLEQLLSDGDVDFQETKDKIIETEKEMKETISRYASDLLQELETKWRPQENKIKTELSTVVKNKDDLVSRKNILDNTLQSRQSSDIFSVSKSLLKTLPDKSNTMIKLKNTKFIQGIKLKKFNIIVLSTLDSVGGVEVMNKID
ncbi:unnamed protein product [Mytilus coruscus]|uniref:B box-type domain-containing protein n=1 Tax=Mytilus coruscus TaxID=42192 RepID=A0A6J8DUY2_MYTCO|nr:unnamed protein product [Mytilus coruscus]